MRILLFAATGATQEEPDSYDVALVALVAPSRGI